MQHVERFAIDQVASAADARGDVLRLENMDTDLPPPPRVLEATRAAIGTRAANSYLPFTGSAALRERIARDHERRTGEAVDPERQVIVTCGASAAILPALLAVAGPGDEVVVQDPMYAGIVNRVRMAGATPVFAPFRHDGGTWALDLEALGAAVTARTRALFMMSPSFPSGALMSADDWMEVARLCAARDLVLIHSAAYDRVVFGGRRIPQPTDFPELRGRTIALGTVTKTFRMIGWRVGWLIFPPAYADALTRAVLFSGSVTPTGIAQAGAVEAFDADAAGEAQVVECVAEWRRRHDAVLAAARPYGAVPAAGGWTLLVNVASRGWSGAEASRRLLELGGVAATPMDAWGERNGPGWVRFVYATEPLSRLADLAPRLAAALD